ncbi:hypothetical protein [Sphingomonas sp. URHD0057]|uniref:hypothetical protein n=1 Tax=Sphingomonas sp. URHD0057 TaxID=1380389 RepID=UPI00048AECC6|nr:hypothetical protein [Sphingomonas sp. URHD0057]
MNRWLALALAIIAGGVAAFAAAIAFVGTVYGFLWIYVYGDNPWPAWVEPVMSVLLFVFAFGVGIGVGWIIWKRLTAPPAAG